MKKISFVLKTVFLFLLSAASLFSQPIFLDEEVPATTEVVEEKATEPETQQETPIRLPKAARPAPSSNNEGQNQLAITSFYQALSLSNSGSQIQLADYGTFYQSDFQHALGVGLEYQRLDLAIDHLSVMAAVDGSYAKNQANTGQLDVTVPVTIFSYGITAGLAYRFMLPAKMYIQPFARGGMGQQWVKVDLANSGVVIQTSDGTNLTEAQNLSATFGRLDAGFRFGFYASQALNLELGGYYQRLFYQDGHGQGLLTFISAGYRI